MTAEVISILIFSSSSRFLSIRFYAKKKGFSDIREEKNVERLFINDVVDDICGGDSGDRGDSPEVTVKIHFEKKTTIKTLVNE